MSPATATATRWCGWHRAGPHAPWQELVAADGEASCWAALQARRVGGDLLVLPQGTTPFDAPAGTRYYRHRRGRGLTQEWLRGARP